MVLEQFLAWLHKRQGKLLSNRSLVEKCTCLSPYWEDVNHQLVLPRVNDVLNTCTFVSKRVNALSVVQLNIELAY